MSNQLFITEFDELYLPTEFHFSHNIAVRLYDDLVWLLKDNATQRKINVTVKFDEKSKRPKENEKDIIGWLFKNGYEKEANEIIVKHVAIGIISDICHFVFQALDSAKRMKMTVAYSLIRKPFLENLIIIEQLLANEKEFLLKFDSKPEMFDPGKLKDTEKKELINKCISKINNPLILTTELVYMLRFDKTNPKSFYAVSNLATHLVTTRHTEFKTEKNNFNFIFSGEEEWGSQLEYFYYFLPYILFYTTEIIDQYFFEKKILSKKEFQKRKFLRLFGQVILFDQFDDKSTKGISLANKITRGLKIKCKHCNKINQIYKSDLYTLVHNHYILCKHCLLDLFNETKSFDEAINKLIK